MHTSITILAILAAALTQGVGAATYKLTQTNVGADFIKNFVWETFADPTGGRVQYISQAQSNQLNLSYARGNTFIMRADDTTVLTPTGPGRKSNRIKSRRQFTTHVAIFNVRHMPQGCATWPAMWETDDTVGTANGELDILEGVNDNPPDTVTVHTIGDCTMPMDRDQLGTSISYNCSSTAQDATGNNGCSVKSSYTTSYGPTFNSAGGGYYAAERTPTYIKVWFWSRTDATAPAEVTSPSSKVANPNNWGTPTAYFPNTNCDFSKLFKANNIIFDLTLCGSYAGSRYTADGCPGNCVDYVNNNPAAFSGAYWNVAGVYVYE